MFDKYFYVGQGNEYYEVWTANYDGTTQQKVNISLLSGITIGGQGNTRLSPDGKTIFFQADDASTNKQHIYACNIDGTNAHKVVDGSNCELSIGGAY